MTVFERLVLRVLYFLVANTISNRLNGVRRDLMDELKTVLGYKPDNGGI
jgi:hypothetical protein